MDVESQRVSSSGAIMLFDFQVTNGRPRLVTWHALKPLMFTAHTVVFVYRSDPSVYMKDGLLVNKKKNTASVALMFTAVKCEEHVGGGRTERESCKAASLPDSS